MTLPAEEDRIRCPWAVAAAGSDRILMRDYHDHEWGRPLRGATPMFERMTLEAFQSGLSWLIVLRKRENFRAAFRGFDVETVAGFTEADIQRLMTDAGIVRNRAKIAATISNARAVVDLGADLSEFLWAHAPSPRPRPAGPADVPAQTPESRALARELKARGFRFVGPTTIYALMQATGMVDDHMQDCWVSPVRGGAGLESS